MNSESINTDLKQNVTAKEEIYVTKPSLPPLHEYSALLAEIWDSKKLTNKGLYHDLLEKELAQFLGVKHCSLFCNGTVALQVAIQALEIEGEVITTPYSFVATSHALTWNKCTPLFSDIDAGYNLDPDAVRKAITPRTKALLPVHVYGIPCDLHEYEKIAQEYGLKLLYDAAHAFGVNVDNESILNFGDISMLSFHATKIFHTAEGGMLVTNNAVLKERIDYLKNFGFKNETTVVGLGCNGKMNELQAALGLLQLNYIDEVIACSRERFNHYFSKLTGVTGIELLTVPQNVTWNYSYFPILVADEYRLDRDGLYEDLKNSGVRARRYFYPLICDMPPYKDSKKPDNVQFDNARERSQRVLCLPLYPDLSFDDVDMICDVIAGRTV